MKNRSRYYVPLLALFIVAVFYQVRFGQARINNLLHGTEQARLPFDADIAHQTINGVTPDAAQAGLLKGDRLLAINGNAFKGIQDLVAPLVNAHPGDALSVRVQHAANQGGAEENLTLRFQPAATRAATAGELVLSIFLSILMPAFCLLLGFWVAALRPFDRLAWLLLAMLLSFSTISTGFDWAIWGTGTRYLAASYFNFFNSTWPVWMLLFGIYFPEKTRSGKFWTWMSWVLIGILLFSTLTDLVVALGSISNVESVAPLEKLFKPYERIAFFSGMIAIGFFFASLQTKAATASTTDARRRLRLLLSGMYISLTPSFILVIFGLFTGNAPFQNVPAWMVIPALLLLFIFPLTFAYVIIVYRAMDVRVVVRQGLQYALAKSGVGILQALLIVVIVITMFSFVNNPDTNGHLKIFVVAAGLTLAFLTRRLAGRLRAWTDRKFFREAYNAEQILSDLSEKVRTMVETGPLLETVAQRISESLHVPRITLLLKNGRTYSPAHALGYEAIPPVTFPEQAATIEQLRHLNEPVLVYADDKESWVYKSPGMNDDERTNLAALQTQLLLPLSVQDKMPGFISLGPKQSEEPYSSTDLRLLQSVATQTGLALENSQLTAAIASEVAQRERLNRELEIAREVQERLFPQNHPSISGLDYCGACRPALGVGGDYYDFLLLPNDIFGIAIGDVSGKGIAAALLMASLQASLRGQAVRGTSDLAELMSNVNQLVFDASATNRYATFFYAQYEPSTHLLTYVNAGHNPPMLLRKVEGVLQVERLEIGGAVVGLLPNFPYQQATIKLEPGDTFVSFTDGISEAMNPAEEEWGEDQMLESVKTCDGLSAADIIARLMTAADAFAAGAKQHDDMTLVIVRVV